MDNQLPTLQAASLSCIRDDRVLFSSLDFSVHGHQILLLEGQNGCGKTSLLRILCGFREPDAGVVLWCGNPCHRSAFYQDMAYVGHMDGVKKELSVAENLNISLALGSQGAMTVDQALEKVRLAGYEDTLVHSLSAGQKRRLSLARLLITKNKLWILDEPFTSLDKQGIKLIESIMLEHVQAGGMIVMTSHHDLAMPSADIQRINLSQCH